MSIFFTKNTMTISDVQKFIGEYGLNRLDMEIHNEVLGELTFLYNRPAWFQFGLKSSLKKFVRWIHKNKPVTVTVRLKTR